jgi:multiple sugar transport system permease protein
MTVSSAATATDVRAAASPRVPTRPPRRSGRARLEWLALHAVGVSLALLFVLPFVFIGLTALMSDEQTLTRNLWPQTWEWHNLVQTWQTPGFDIWWRNTIVYAVVGTILTVVSSFPVAYALARFRFRGRSLALGVVIATMMLPPQVVIVPMYLVWAQQFHLSGTLWPLIIPMAFGDAFSIFLLRQFLLTIPSEYVDAAKVDGCTDFRAMIHIVIPMARPAIAAVALFQFFYCWNDYFGPQIYASENPGAWTLSYGLETFKSAHHTDWNLTMAATLMVMAPVIVLFFFAQKAFIEGVTLTGVKG